MSSSHFHPSVGVDSSAALLIKRHGLHAFDFAVQQADGLEAAGATMSATHWRAIARAIERLLAKSKATPA